MGSLYTCCGGLYHAATSTPAATSTLRQRRSVTNADSVALNERSRMRRCPAFGSRSVGRYYSDRVGSTWPQNSNPAASVTLATMEKRTRKPRLTAFAASHAPQLRRRLACGAEALELSQQVEKPGLVRRRTYGADVTSVEVYAADSDVRELRNSSLRREFFESPRLSHAQHPRCYAIRNRASHG